MTTPVNNNISPEVATFMVTPGGMGTMPMPNADAAAAAPPFPAPTANGGAPTAPPILPTGPGTAANPLQPPVGETPSAPSMPGMPGMTTPGSSLVTPYTPNPSDWDGATVSGGGPGALGSSRGMRNLGTHMFGVKKPLKIGIGSAQFSFPPVAVSNRSHKAPKVTWGAGWKSLGGGKFQHTNGTKAFQGIQPRVSVGDPSKIHLVNTPHGRGQQLPNGTVVGIAKSGRPFMMKADGTYSSLSFGTHTIGGQKVRVFNATTVGLIAPDGRFMRYDSRGNVRLGRGSHGLVSGGGPSAAITGSSQLTPNKVADPAPLKKGDTGDGPPPPGGDATPVKTPPPSSVPPPGQANQIQMIQQIIKVIQQLIIALQSGSSDPSSLPNKPGFSQMPAGISQAFCGIVGMESDPSANNV